LVKDAVCKITLWRIVAPIVEGADFSVVLLELALEQVMVSRLTGESIAVLCQHNIDTTIRYEVSNAVHTWPFKAGPALSGVYYLLEDLVAFTGSVLS
jgi:hypothetical protein